MTLKSAASWLACLLLAGKTFAANLTVPDSPEDASNPYSVISQRNVFHLNPIPPPPAPEAPKPDLPVIKLSGFFTLGSTVRACFSSVPKDKKQEPANYTLTDGEKSSDNLLEVLRIHQDTGEVEILNSGTRMTLSLKDDTLASNEAAPKPAGAARHGPPMMPGMIPNASPDRWAERRAGANPFAFPMRPRGTPMSQ